VERGSAAERDGQLDPQSLVAVQSVDVLIGCSSFIAAKLPWSFGNDDMSSDSWTLPNPPDCQRILHTARDDTRQGLYERALEKFLWFLTMR